MNDNTITLYACPEPGCRETFDEKGDYWVHYREEHIPFYSEADC